MTTATPASQCRLCSAAVQCCDEARRWRAVCLNELSPYSPENEDPRAKAEIEATFQHFAKMLNEVAAIKSARAYESS